MSDIAPFDGPVTRRELGETLRHRREAAGLSRAALEARVHGLGVGTVNQWEHGRNLAHVETFLHALDALGCRVTICKTSTRIFKPPLTR